MPTTVVNVSNNVPFDVYIGRKKWLSHDAIGCDGYFGNPYRSGGRTSKTLAIALFKSWFEKRMKSDPKYRDHVEALRGKVLACHCKPHACHGDVIAEYLDGREEA